MRKRGTDDAGFSLLEVVIAMFLLGVIAIAILPVLWNGIAFSSQQANTATATRYLNSVVDQARDSARTATDKTSWCTAVKSNATANIPQDSKGVALFSVPVDATSCAAQSGSMMKLSLIATMPGAQGTTLTLASVSALVYIR
ncbi:prepilin-type N-terminal cleavage/methylation domain-containing protein [Microbacterium trichothecenolyticum]|uniref:type IV pilus modification PilV family protein n=1 Tax=Microbacterium trichothecenolyticum TaxID=69370 RepID=UPI00285F690D|nr:prepilin-type N-terminal cleavage/methylation domain-containing protein [Microbacterium trichothecenolyticum]MDR7185774.1 prepilin-type N-terminal cleavage/methylation domain-containing protein [Microbacterium trichothecenolyticum]